MQNTMNKKLYTNLRKTAKAILDRYENLFVPQAKPVKPCSMTRYYNLGHKINYLFMDICGFTNSDFRAYELVREYNNQMIYTFQQFQSLLAAPETGIYPINLESLRDLAKVEFIHALRDSLQLVAHIFGYADKYTTISEIDYTGYNPLTAESLDGPEDLAVAE